MSEIFRRVEKKYIINKEQYQKMKEFLNEKMIEDEHGKSTICNIYFDTDNFDLIRHSITKPMFKEKIRSRSYNTPTLDSKIFLEIKRKYNKIVSKRRIEMCLSDFYSLCNTKEFPNSQIGRELNYYFKLYNLSPKVYISYFRRAYYDKDNMDFRITFDSNIGARTYDLELEKGNYGKLILEKDKYIMEIKTLGAIPLWLIKHLNDLKIAPCGFSKYGEAYNQLILKANQISKYVIQGGI